MPVSMIMVMSVPAFILLEQLPKLPFGFAGSRFIFMTFPRVTMIMFMIAIVVHIMYVVHIVRMMVRIDMVVM